MQSYCVYVTLVKSSPDANSDIASSESPKLPGTLSSAAADLSLETENPLPSLPNLSDDSGSEEDPTIETKHRYEATTQTEHRMGSDEYPMDAVPTRLSAAARIDMAVSKSNNSMAQPQSDTSNRDTEHRDMCRVGATAKISMAVAAKTTTIGRRLSSMLHNNRLRQSTTTTGT